MSLIRLIFSLFILLFLPIAVIAQETQSVDVAAVEQLRSDVDAIANALDAGPGSDEALAELASRADAISTKLIESGVEISPRLSQIRTRLDQIGPPPAEGEPPEPEPIADERQTLSNERAQLNQMIGVLEEQSIRVKNLTDNISDARRKVFTESLARRYNIGDAFSTELISDISERSRSLGRRISSWASFVWRFQTSWLFVGLGLIAAFVLASLVFARRVFADWIHRAPGAEPSYFHRTTTAFWFTIIPTVVFTLLLGLSLLTLFYLDLLRDDITRIIGTAMVAISIIFLIWRLAEAVFAPSHPNWRMLAVSDHAAGPIKRFIILLAIITTADVFITQVNQIVGVSVPITVAKSLITSILTGALLVRIAFLRPFAEQDHAGNIVKSSWPWLVRNLLLIAGIGLILLALTGYIGLARFAAQEIVVTGAVLATMYLGYRTANAIAGEGAFSSTRAGQHLMNQQGFSETAVDRMGLVAGGVLSVVILVVGLPVLAILWGFQLADVQRFAVNFFTDIQIGSISISITSILAGVVLFLFGLFITRRFQRWLDGNVLERSRIDDGARNSIRTAIGYVGVAIAGLVGVSAAGLELSQLALVAGALSLGIGFGLQNIVSNFVSGLILLAERPFKTGDIIEAGGFTGVVRNVNVRATEIDTFDKKTLVLPNSELINSAVVNWVHKTTMGRIEVAVGVSYDSDPQLVHDLLLEIANDHPRILANPEAFVEFADFGASSLDFTLRGYIADIGFGIPVRNELRIAIYQRFKAAGIEIPFPQRDVNLKLESGETQKTVEKFVPKAFDVIKTSKKRVVDDGE